MNGLQLLSAFSSNLFQLVSRSIDLEKTTPLVSFHFISDSSPLFLLPVSTPPPPPSSALRVPLQFSLAFVSRSLRFISQSIPIHFSNLNRHSFILYRVSVPVALMIDFQLNNCYYFIIIMTLQTRCFRPNVWNCKINGHTC